MCLGAPYRQCQGQRRADHGNTNGHQEGSAHGTGIDQAQQSAANKNGKEAKTKPRTGRE